MSERDDDIFLSRRSVRGFLKTPVSRSLLIEILTCARAAPSGANLQPGKFHVFSGAPLRRLSDAIVAGETSGAPHAAEYSYFPNPMPPELKELQRKAGYALYGAIGIERRDVEARRAQFMRNYRFFDAPVGIVVTIRRDMGKGCFMDLGMALQNLLLAAHARGVGACGIGALANHGPLIHDHLKLPDDELVVCGIALGYADPNHPANSTRTDRLSIEEFSDFHGFED